MTLCHILPERKGLVNMVRKVLPHCRDAVAVFFSLSRVDFKEWYSCCTSAGHYNTMMYNCSLMIFLSDNLYLEKSIGHGLVTYANLTSWIYPVTYLHMGGMGFILISLLCPSGTGTDPSGDSRVWKLIVKSVKCYSPTVMIELATSWWLSP